MYFKEYLTKNVFFHVIFHVFFKHRECFLPDFFHIAQYCFLSVRFCDLKRNLRWDPKKKKREMGKLFIKPMFAIPFIHEFTLFFTCVSFSSFWKYVSQQKRRHWQFLKCKFSLFFSLSEIYSKTYVTFFPIMPYFRNAEGLSFAQTSFTL